jgi:hypothetical protein
LNRERGGNAAFFVQQAGVFCPSFHNDYGWRPSWASWDVSVNGESAGRTAPVETHPHPELAKEARAIFIPLPAMPERHILDGIHLNAAGYEVWDRAILQGIESEPCKSM